MLKHNHKKMHNFKNEHFLYFEIPVNTDFWSKAPGKVEVFWLQATSLLWQRNKDFSKAMKVGTRGAQHQPEKFIYLSKKVQHSELISLLLQPHLQHALDSPTTTSRSFLSALRRASSTSSEISECAERLCSAATRPRSEVCSFHVWELAGPCSLAGWWMLFMIHGSNVSPSRRAPAMERKAS